MTFLKIRAKIFWTLRKKLLFIQSLREWFITFFGFHKMYINLSSSILDHGKITHHLKLQNIFKNIELLQNEISYDCIIVNNSSCLLSKLLRLLFPIKLAGLDGSDTIIRSSTFPPFRINSGAVVQWQYLKLICFKKRFKPHGFLVYLLLLWFCNGHAIIEQHTNKTSHFDLWKLTFSVPV